MPANAISFVRILATPATIAFGGVPTGKWKAIEHERAVGYMKSNGWTCIVCANSPTIGNMTFATATFDVNSVMNDALKQIMNKTSRSGKFLASFNEPANIDDIPVFLPPLANAKPPPNKKIKLHGTFWLMYFHVIKPCSGFVGSWSVKKKRNWENID